MPIVETDEQYKKRVLDNVISFLKNNEQYGDDWDSEIKVLRSFQGNGFSDEYILMSSDEFPLAPLYELGDGQTVMTDFNVFFDDCQIDDGDNFLKVIMYQKHGIDLDPNDRVDMVDSNERFKVLIPFTLIKSIVNEENTEYYSRCFVNLMASLNELDNYGVASSDYRTEVERLIEIYNDRLYVQ